jgi:hypothetical protein
MTKIARLVVDKRIRRVLFLNESKEKIYGVAKYKSYFNNENQNIENPREFSIQTDAFMCLCNVDFSEGHMTFDVKKPDDTNILLTETKDGDVNLIVIKKNEVPSLKILARAQIGKPYWNVPGSAIIREHLRLVAQQRIMNYNKNLICAPTCMCLIENELEALLGAIKRHFLNKVPIHKYFKERLLKKLAIYIRFEFLIGRFQSPEPLQIKIGKEFTSTCIIRAFTRTGLNPNLIGYCDTPMDITLKPGHVSVKYGVWKVPMNIKNTQ